MSVYKMYLEAVLICPHCGYEAKYLSPDKKDAVSASNEFVCSVCNAVFEVYLIAPDSQRHPSTHAADGAKCARCGDTYMAHQVQFHDHHFESPRR